MRNKARWKKLSSNGILPTFIHPFNKYFGRVHSMYVTHYVSIIPILCGATDSLNN